MLGGFVPRFHQARNSVEKELQPDGVWTWEEEGKGF